jgi:hypothetical protein
MSHPACDHLGKMAFSASHPPRFYLAATTVISISIPSGRRQKIAGLRLNRVTVLAARSRGGTRRRFDDAL